MGLESGSEEGLTTLHKQITVEQNLRAVATLRLGIMFEFGLMLFDPFHDLRIGGREPCFFAHHCWRRSRSRHFLSYDCL